MPESNAKNSSPSDKEGWIARIIKGRIRGKAILTEFQNEEMPPSLTAALNAAKETAILSLLLFLLFSQELFTHIALLVIFSMGWLLWKASQNALSSWIRLEKLHKILQDERWEITHHRKAERKELETLYQAKGFSGKLLDEVVNTLMADDNRLLQIMVEEEMGLALGSYEHPLKQALGAALGVFLAFILISLGFFFSFSFGIYLSTALILIFTSFLSTKYEKSDFTFSILWNLAIALLISCFAFFLSRLV